MNPKQIILLLSICLIANYSAAQKELFDKRMPGWFINANGDTIRGFILYSNKIDNQKYTEYSNDKNAEKIKFNLVPEQIVTFKTDTFLYQSLEYGEADPTPQHFLLLIEEGKLTLYKYFFYRKDEYINEGNTSRPVNGYDENYLLFEYVIKNASGELFTISGQGTLNKQAGKIFTGAPNIISKIDERELRFDDLSQIVKEYNNTMLLH